MYISKIVKCTYLLASKMAKIAIFVCTFQMETEMKFKCFLTHLAACGGILSLRRPDNSLPT